MKLQTKYILFVVILHTTALVLSYVALQNHLPWFLLAEVVILASVVLSWHIYKQLLRPLQLLMQGAEAIRDKDFTVRLLPSGSYEMDSLIHIYNQMIDELRNERTLHEQQHLFLEKLINTSPTGIIILDYDNRVQQVNPQAQHLLATLPPYFINQVQALASGKSSVITINGIATYKLQKSHFIDKGFARHFVMIEELTDELLAAEKKAYGKVIRMMAHEVNNSVGAVSSILQSALASKSLWQNNQEQPLQHALQVAIDRNYNLNYFMRNFADLVRLPPPVKQQIDVHALLLSVASLMEHKARERQITIDYAAVTGPFYIQADIQQLEQVVINVVKNAIEAIDTNGTVTFQLNATERTLAITDNGKGITPEEAEQLFSPFFSTKRDGQGIGLTLVKEILLSHGFSFSLQQPPNGNTAFTIQFPEYQP